MGVTYDPATRTALVITSGASAKAGTSGTAAARVAVCQVDGRRWVTPRGRRGARRPAAVADAVERYAHRYRQPRVNPARVAIEISVDLILGTVTLDLSAVDTTETVRTDRLLCSLPPRTSSVHPRVQDHETQRWLRIPSRTPDDAAELVGTSTK